MAEKRSESKEENETLGIVGGALTAVGWALLEIGDLFLIFDTRDKFRDTLKSLAIILGGGLVIAAIGKALTKDAQKSEPVAKAPAPVKQLPPNEPTHSPSVAPSVATTKKDVHHSTTRRWQTKVVDKLEDSIRSV